MVRRILLSLVVVVTLLSCGSPPKNTEPNTPPSLAAAIHRATADHQRVLVLGGEMSELARIEKALKGARLRRLVNYEYQVEKLSEDDFASLLGEKFPSPALAILGGDGVLLIQAALFEFEKLVGENAEPMRKVVHEEALELFLLKWQAPHLDAAEQLEKALQNAEKTERRVLVHLGAPW